MIRQYKFSFKIICGDISNDDRFLIFGTANSCIRIIDITDLDNFKIIKSIRIFNKDKKIVNALFSPDQ